jgi:hypothetical protein
MGICLLLVPAPIARFPDSFILLGIFASSVTGYGNRAFSVVGEMTTSIVDRLVIGADS